MHVYMKICLGLGLGIVVVSGDFNSRCGSLEGIMF